MLNGIKIYNRKIFETNNFKVMFPAINNNTNNNNNNIVIIVYKIININYVLVSIYEYYYVY